MATMLKDWPEQAATARLLERYSLEMIAKDVPGLREASHLIPRGTRISVTFLPGETFEARIEAASVVRALGFVPVPHLSARRFHSDDELHEYLEALRDRAQVEDVFVVAGDLPRPAGPYEDALALIRNGALAQYGVRHVGVAGYPEGHPDISARKLNAALHEKQGELKKQGLGCSIMTQFGFDAKPVLAWLERIRSDGISVPVHVGLPGPASVKTLLRFAARCGVGASVGVMKKYGASITKLLTTAGPDLIIDELAAEIDAAIHGEVVLHLYPFGGLARTAEWMHAYAREHADRQS